MKLALPKWSFSDNIRVIFLLSKSCFHGDFQRLMAGCPVEAASVVAFYPERLIWSGHVAQTGNHWELSLVGDGTGPA